MCKDCLRFCLKVECKKAQPKEVMSPTGTARGRSRVMPYGMDAFMLGIGMLGELKAVLPSPRFSSWNWATFKLLPWVKNISTGWFPSPCLQFWCSNTNSVKNLTTWWKKSHWAVFGLLLLHGLGNPGWKQEKANNLSELAHISKSSVSGAIHSCLMRVWRYLLFTIGNCTVITNQSNKCLIMQEKREFFFNILYFENKATVLIMCGLGEFTK